MITVALYATDTMADWEYGYLIAGLAMAREQNPDANRLLVASESGEAVTTMGKKGELRDKAADIPDAFYDDGVPQFEYQVRDDRHFVLLSSKAGKTQTLVLWHDLSPSAQCALTNVFWNDGKMPMSDEVFEDKLKYAWNDIGRQFE